MNEKLIFATRLTIDAVFSIFKTKFKKLKSHWRHYIYTNVSYSTQLQTGW